MITIFALPKPFRGHIDIIQRNAIASWARLRPKPEIILFYHEEGTEEVARELGIRYVPDVGCNEFGTPMLNDLFAKARVIASHDILCYANADMLLPGEFMTAVGRVALWRDRFLIVGRRTNLDFDEMLDFESPGWEARLSDLAAKRGASGPPNSIDYFVFTRNLELDMPPFAIGRPWWDNWFIWRVRSLKAPVVDASRVVTAIHQNHDYAHVNQGLAGVFGGPEGRRNLGIVGLERVYTIDDASHKLTASRIKRNVEGLFVQSLIHAWNASMRRTSSIRHRLGIRRDQFERLAKLARRTRATKE